MSKQQIEQLIQTALTTLKQAGTFVVDAPRIQIDATKDKQHGDFASNIALILAKQAGCKPRELAEKIVAALPASSQVTKVEIAGPGFINFFLSTSAFYSVITDILSAGKNYGRSQVGNGKRILIEFVSSNPTGPLHVGHGRHAAYGAVVSDLLAAIGYDVYREYYVNDAGRQMDILTASVWLRYLQLNDETLNIPANAYRGEYVIDIARALKTKYGHKFVAATSDIFENLPPDEPEGGDKEIYIDAFIARAKTLLGEASYQALLAHTLDMILADIRNDLQEFGVQYQNWFSEREFIRTGAVDRDVQTLQKKGLLYERDNALWFRSTDFDDDKDRVVKRGNGQNTYFANDVGYHYNKFERGFDSAIDIFGSDHHGYIPRMKAAMRAFDVDPNKLTYLLMQFVTLYRGGEQVQMSTRSGSFVTLRELREEVGNDVARFFYVMRKCEQHMDFDLDLAKSQTNENPVYYIQYAHARICSVFRQLADKNYVYHAPAQFDVLKEPQELQLLTTLSRYPDVIMAAATQFEPHILTNYLRDLAADFHGYYNTHQFIVDDESLRNARLALILATQQVLINGLTLVGVSTPESM
jgi:arginyl-tRNA synthetase